MMVALPHADLNHLAGAIMRTKALFNAAAFAILISASGAMAMGGMGGYGSMGTGMSPGMMHSAGFDDYATALRLIHEQKYADAIPHLQRALADRPHSADVLNYLGFTERMVGNYTVSLDYYQRALHEDPDHKGAHEYLGELYLDLKDLNSANQQLAELVRLCPDGCVERQTLLNAIAAYQANGATPGQAPAASASQTGQ